MLQEGRREEPTATPSLATLGAAIGAFSLAGWKNDRGGLLLLGGLLAT